MRVDPRSLLLCGIEAGPTDSIEPGYHLRWFTGPGLAFPQAAFPDQATLSRIYALPNLAALTWQNSNTKPGSPYNDIVPPAFFVCRRPHRPFFPNRFLLTFPQASALAATGRSDTGVPELSLSSDLRRPRTVVPTPWVRAEDPQETKLPTWWERIEATVLDIGFHDGADASKRRVVHFLRLRLSMPPAPEPQAIVLEAYADGEERPMRQITGQWRGTAAAGWTLTLDLVQGHYDRILVVLPIALAALVDLIRREALVVEIQYCFMDQDTKFAAPGVVPQPGDWVTVQTVPFITFFQTWAAARDYHFRYPLKNRYLDFSDAPQGARLDLRYGSVFWRLQQVFLAFQQATNLGRTWLEEVRGTLARLRRKPDLLFQLWSMDPFVSTLFGLAYGDVPGAHNPNPPVLGTTYDYMVMSAWQPEAERYCYIAQKISQPTTPPVMAPAGVSGRQEPGVSRDRGALVYPVSLGWTPQSQAGNFTAYEPPFYDVRRGDSATAMQVLTQYVDTTPGVPEAEQIVDAPVNGVTTPPDPDAPGTTLSQTQRSALALQRVLHEGDSRVAIRQADVDAYTQMRSTTLRRFFNAPAPAIRFMEWIPLAGEQDGRSLYYSVRGIDLFGRTSAWTAPLAVNVAHTMPPAAPVSVRAWPQPGAAGAPIEVSWRYGAAQAQSGPVPHHFSVLGRFGPPQALPVSGSPSAVLYGAWKPGKLPEPAGSVLYRPPVALGVLAETSNVTGTSISGTILEVSERTGADAVAEESALLGGNRMVILTTDQCWLGVSPFVDVATRYRSPVSPDTVRLTANGVPYTVVMLETGATLRLGIPVAATAPQSPSAWFLARLGAVRTFQLSFTSVRVFLTWTETLSRANLPDLWSDSEVQALANQADPNPLIDELVGAGTLRLRFQNGPDITGRESWLRDEPAFVFTYLGREYWIPVVDYELAETEESGPPGVAPVVRRRITGLTLAAVIQEGDAEAGGAVPTPVFPREMITAIVSATGLAGSWRLWPSQVVRITTDVPNDTSPAATTLRGSAGGELAFARQIGTLALEVSGEVLTRPCPVSSLAGATLSFLMRRSSRPPSAPLGTAGVLPRPAMFYPTYRAVVPYGVMPGAPPAGTPATLTIGVAAHAHPAAADGTEVPGDDGNIVSRSEPLRVPGAVPAGALAGVALPSSPTGDPFVDRDTSTPRLLDNRAVTQIRIDLSDRSSLGIPAGGTPPWPPAAGTLLEILRAPEDGLRIELARIAGAARAASDVIAYLVGTPGLGALAAGFSRVALLCGPGYADPLSGASAAQLGLRQGPDFVDQINAAAAGRYYYAVRATRAGSPPSPPAILPLRARIPDRAPLAEPAVTRISRGDAAVTIEWQPVPDPRVKAYEIHRLANGQRIGAATFVAKRYVDAAAAAADPGGVLAERVPLALRPAVKQLIVLGGRLNLLFPLSAFGVARLDDIVGLYVGSPPSNFTDPAYNFAADANNLWPGLRPGLSLADGDRVIAGFPAALLGEGGRPMVRIVCGPGSPRELILRCRVLSIDGIPTARRQDISGVFLIERDVGNVYPADTRRVVWDGNDLRLLVTDDVEAQLQSGPERVRIELANPVEVRSTLNSRMIFADGVAGTPRPTYRVRSMLA